MAKKKLSDAEINRIVAKIRQRYDAFIIKYLKPLNIRNGFEERYLQALRDRMDLERFVAAEITVLDELGRREEEKILAAQELAFRRKAAGRKSGRKDSGKKQDFADRIIEMNMLRIAGYPGIGLTDEIAYEVDKLYGAMARFEAEYWPGIERIYRRIYTSRFSGPRIIIENRLFDLTAQGPSKTPPKLTAFTILLKRISRDDNNLDRERRLCIMEAAFTLHMISDELERLKGEEDLQPDELKTVEKCESFVHTVIEDFRLKDLKPRKG